MTKFAIRLDYEPVWFCDGVEEWFDTEQEAEQALIQYFQECEEAVALGYMEDCGDDADFRIVELVNV